MTDSERRICLLCNNVDLKIDTGDSKNEFHKTGIAVYQYLKNNKGNLSNLRKNLEKLINQGDHIFMELLNRVTCLRPLMENYTSNSYRKQINLLFTSCGALAICFCGVTILIKRFPHGKNTAH